MKAFALAIAAAILAGNILAGALDSVTVDTSNHNERAQLAALEAR